MNQGRGWRRLRTHSARGLGVTAVATALVLFGPSGFARGYAAELVESAPSAAVDEALLTEPSDGEEAADLPTDYLVAPTTVGDLRYAADKALAEIESDYGPRLGIIAVLDDGSGFSVPVVGLTEEEGKDIAGRAPDGVSFVPATAQVTVGELYGLRDLLYAELSKVAAEEIMVGIDVELGVVEVGVSPKDSQREEVEQSAGDLAAGYGAEMGGRAVAAADLVRVATVEQSPTEVRDEAPARGGRWVNFPANPSGGACTIGFVVKNSAGSFRALSAGHCADAGDLAEAPSGTNFGNVVHDQAPDPGADTADSLAFALPTNYDGRGVVTVSSTGSYRQVVGQRNRSQQYANDSFCFTGRGLIANTSDDERCGQIKRMGVLWFGAEENCIERRNYSGDSGGPMYALDANGKALAGGTTSHLLTESHPIWSDSHFTCYVLIDDALDGLYTLITEK